MQNITKTIIDTANFMLVILDKDGNIQEFNRQATNLTGYQKEEVLGKNWFDLFVPESDRHNLLRVFNDIFNTKNMHWNHENPIICKDGTLIQARWNNALIIDTKHHANTVLALGIDITDLKDAHEKVKEQSEFLQTVIDGINTPIMVINPDYTINLMNKAARDNIPPQCTGDAPCTKCYEASHHLRSPCSTEHHLCPLREVLKHKKSVKAIHLHPDKEGQPRYVELESAPLWNKDGSLRGVIEVSHDVTDHVALLNELQIQKESLQHQAEHDALTNLPNRFLFNDRLQQAITKAHRNKEQLALFFIDLDRFKEINDSLGHLIGDEVLKAVAKRLRKATREEDTAARLGGDEFTVIIESLNPRSAALLAQKIITKIQKPIKVDGHEFHITTSIGISLYPQDGTTIETLLSHADSAMYKAKEKGRNTFEFYTENMTKQVFERVQMESKLQHALKKEEFILYYQPQVNHRTGQIIGLEALLRWNHPDLGMLSPDHFITLAEETGLIQELGKWVLLQACSQTAKWYEMGLNPGRIAVNLSGKQLEEDTLFASVRDILNESGCKPQWLELEVTEESVMAQLDESIDLLNRFRDLGIELAIDNFGTGYLSLPYLMRLPINKLKIDHSFIQHVHSNIDDSAITKAVIALAQSLNLGVIAEGVETREQANFLQESECEEVQGYYFGKPSNAYTTTALIKQWPQSHQSHL